MSSVGEEGRRGVNCGERDARKEGEVTAGQTNTRSVRWDQEAISDRVCARTVTSRCIKCSSLLRACECECARAGGCTCARACKQCQ